MAETQGAGQPGLFPALKNIAATLLASGRTRLELLGNEFEEEKLRALRVFIVAQGMLFCFGVAALLIVALLAMLLWEGRLAVVGGCAALFLILGFVFLARLREAVQRPDKAFATSLAELEEDIRQLKSALGDEQAPR